MLQNTITIILGCQYYNSSIYSQPNSHETKGVIFTHVCPFYFTKNGKSFQHTEANYRSKLGKKLVSLGVGSTSACYFSSRIVWSTINNSEYTKKALLVDKHTALSWFHSFLKLSTTGVMVGHMPRFFLHIQNLKLLLTHYMTIRTLALSRSHIPWHQESCPSPFTKFMNTNSKTAYVASFTK